MNSSKILITVDLEDWFQVENLRALFPHSTWESCEYRLEGPVHALLDLFDSHATGCTFFVLGWLAERYPEMIREIHKRGHEIASHGYNHQLCTEISPVELKEDLQKSRELLEDITGEAVSGYRAPSFSVTAELINLLAETGYLYDSSYNSFSLNSRYGSLDGSWSEKENGILQSATGFYEIPVTNLEIARRTIPWGGGGFFRLYPLSLFCRGVKHILVKQKYYMFYCHPWEFDHGQPRVKGLRPDFRFRHYVGLSSNLIKLDAFLSQFSKYDFLLCSQCCHG